MLAARASSDDEEEIAGTYIFTAGDFPGCADDDEEADDECEDVTDVSLNTTGPNVEQHRNELVS